MQQSERHPTTCGGLSVHLNNTRFMSVCTYMRQTDRERQSEKGVIPSNSVHSDDFQGVIPSNSVHSDDFQGVIPSNSVHSDDFQGMIHFKSVHSADFRA
ncbi:hypothetical protein CHS0354_042518 [Potamilus streckersoni]|uniref:Uncharacterized protein n=1 Tax=Potamilus streckersoni TaxID=2493646 RepID=A0AAE0TDT0_9BIVA|nr:hypothetical protein CHS0354_042518 [Potamilus streckersoni]